MQTFNLATIRERLTFVPEEAQPLEQVPQRIYTADLETDPFSRGEMIFPFAAGFYDGENFSSYWGSRCLNSFFDFLETVPPGIVYFHNLGGFDFFWMLKHFTGKTLIRNSRIVKTQVKALDGFHEFRDSYVIMPFPLADIKIEGKRVKLEIDIQKMRRSRREEHRAEILSYLKVDCTSLHYAVTRFWERFGNKLTVGSTAMGELETLHDYVHIKDPLEDKMVRDNFYYGGRVQCFQAGVIKGPFKVFDVNSMYPFVMREYLHPISAVTSITQKITKDTCFISAEGWNYGAFPKRDKIGSLHFDVPFGIFSVSIHEWDIALKYGLFKPRRIIQCLNYKLRRSFADFVNTFYNLRKQAKAEGDDVLALFYKYILNSAYGKFAQDSSKYCDYQITPIDVNLATKGCVDCHEDFCDKHWRPDLILVEVGMILWKKNNPKPKFYNVSTGCSITGAGRAVIMEAIAKAEGAIYCDTDSIICRNLQGVKFSDSELGAWKLEAQGDKACIAGRKLYALYDGKECVKQANKGVQLSPAQITFIAKDTGREVLYEREAPSLKLDGTHRFLARRIRRTV
jgi:hypothetical protein